MTHPLTSRICQELIREKGGSNYAHHFLEDQMRAAADWQLEQVIEWIKECPSYDLDFYSECRRMIADLKKAMRPQEES